MSPTSFSAANTYLSQRESSKNNTSPPTTPKPRERNAHLLSRTVSKLATPRVLATASVPHQTLGCTFSGHHSSYSIT